ncbi:hypothetical protein KC19_7G009100 [Ceratodon purpureus]|uniref:Uncharacterized protein n=1 Tax=Ceratodon purpureus TaxID=3225 RepID=A0A8T0H6B5_CERPU|nr:hypothetical protein KC19_7G009100 [Ceratodon purpureus]
MAPKVRKRAQSGRRDSAGGKKRKQENGDGKRKSRDEEILSEEEEEDRFDGEAPVSDEEEEEEVDLETADEKRLRIARAFLDRTRKAAAEAEEDEDDETAEQRMGARDSMVADLLQQEQLEESGRVQRKLASRVVQPSVASEGRTIGRRHRQSVTAICVTDDDTLGFSASKDGMIVQWDIETGKSEKYEMPGDSVAPSTANGGLVQGSTIKKTSRKGSKHILALAVSSDGRYLASGGLDRAIHLWDTRTRQHLQAFNGHRGAVTGLAFRQGTQQLMSSSLDRTIKLWSVEDRSYIDTLYGHQSDVIAIDCLRQERILSAGRDRTLRLWKVPEESQLVFRGHHAHIESCCFITNGEFLSGSDDGCVALWSTLKKKPVFLAHGAHGSHKSHYVNGDLSNGDKPSEQSSTLALANGNSNGHIEEHSVSSEVGAAESWVGAVAVCRASDLAASGAGDGSVQLWALQDTNRVLEPLHKLPVKGFVNSLAFAHSGRFLLAGTGQEPRMGRWGKTSAARNGVIMHSIELS